MLLKSFLIKKYFPVKENQSRERSLRWVNRGEVLKILFDSSQIKDVIKLRERFWSEGIVVQLVCVAKQDKLYTDVLYIVEKGWISKKVKSLRQLSAEMPKGGVLLSLYEKSSYMVNHVVSSDDSVVKIGVNVAQPELYDLSFSSASNENLSRTIDALIALIKTIEIR